MSVVTERTDTAVEEAIKVEKEMRTQKGDEKRSDNGGMAMLV